MMWQASLATQQLGVGNLTLFLYVFLNSFLRKLCLRYVFSLLNFP